MANKEWIFAADMAALDLRRDDPHHTAAQMVRAAVDAAEPLIRADEIAKYDEVWRGAHEQYRRDLRAAVEVLKVEHYHDNGAVAMANMVLAMIDGQQ